MIYDISVFLFLICFTWYDHLWSRLCCCKWHCFILFCDQHATVYTYCVFFVHPSADGRLGCFPTLAVVHSVAVDTGVPVSFRIILLSEYMPTDETARWSGSCIFSFLRDLHIVLHDDCTNFHSHQLNFVISAVTVCVRQYSAASLCVFLLTVAGAPFHIYWSLELPALQLPVWIVCPLFNWILCPFLTDA